MPIKEKPKHGKTQKKTLKNFIDLNYELKDNKLVAFQSML